MPPSSLPPRCLLFYAIVQRIPLGRVATYGQVARLAGVPRGGRQVGRALRLCPEEESLPWHRVVSADGSIALRGDGAGEELQRLLLLDEGVAFTRSGRVDLDRCGWQG
jgi:methylated-DNA-protein-cysteine methyltransferase-like protein